MTLVAMTLTRCRTVFVHAAPLPREAAGADSAAAVEVRLLPADRFVVLPSAWRVRVPTAPNDFVARNVVNNGSVS